jgi:hypothetical protein
VVNEFLERFSHPQPLPRDLDNLLVGLRRRPARIYDYNPPRFPLGNRHIPIVHSRKETPLLLLKAIFIVSAPRGL